VGERNSEEFRLVRQLNVSSYTQIMKKLDEDYLTELVLEVSFSHNSWTTEFSTTGSTLTIKKIRGRAGTRRVDVENSCFQKCYRESCINVC
jgi:hypothetical protein